MLVFAILACGTPAPQAPDRPAEKPAVEVAPAPEAPAAEADLRTRASAVFAALPTDASTENRSVTPSRVDLGRMLYFDTRLSSDETVSCNSCHLLDKYGVDGTPVSSGVDGQKGGRNAPTVYNAALHIAQFWDGRAADVEEQAKGPVLNPIEMAMADEAAVLKRLEALPGYVEAFAEAFPGAGPALTYDNMGIAIGAFERTLLTPGPLDAWLGGDDTALTAAQQEGLELFMSTGCTACHSGALLGGTTYQKLGAVRPYEDGDKGREEVTGKEADRQMFKVPSLRNIAETGPWFHHGKVATLTEAIQLMGSHQLGKDLSADEVAKIETFLGALTGPLPDAKHIAKPELP